MMTLRKIYKTGLSAFSPSRWRNRLTPWCGAAGVVLLGMTAYFAGVTQAPITAFIIVLEITGRLSLPVPLIAAVIAAAMGRLICPLPLYHALAKGFVAKARRPEAGGQSGGAASGIASS